ncbi:MAG: 4-alpha-glucanotransferase [Proteobacteria bacterium]|nr:4-alpha-glucanotransferase [Pseudomonadota bacterium]MCP4921841.1 4-alpha-glucanotransferase [Pseudomonadota bacterium]
MRRSGVLLHVTSLPSRGPVGDLGPSARAFVDWLAESGQSLWQWLPLNPLGPGNSPYASPSALACERALLSLEDLGLEPLSRTERVDWDAVHCEKVPRLAAAAVELATDLDAWIERTPWADDWGLYATLAEEHGGGWWCWPTALQDRKGLGRVRRRKAYRRHLALQCLLDRQLTALREYASERGVQLIGDVPIFVSGDGCDTWAHRELFQLDADGRPTVRAGVPPDYFSPTGQLWGNPHYDDGAMAAAGYRWWGDRFERVLQHVDRVRIDHFRGFAAAWAVPREAETAMDGGWVEGPGMRLFDALGLDPCTLIAEDLGVITPDVEALRDALGAPGMKVLQFAFGDDDMRHTFLPHAFETPNVVAYTGTHDNDTAQGWYDAAPEEVRHRFRVYARSGGSAWDLVRLAWMSTAHDAIAPLQDVLGLGNEARMNVPGVAEGNWGWRTSGVPGREHADRLRELTWASGRLPRVS